MKIRQSQRVVGMALCENDRGYSKRPAKTIHVHERSIHCLFWPSLSPILMSIKHVFVPRNMLRQVFVKATVNLKLSFLMEIY